MVKAMKRQMRYVARSQFVRGLSSLLDIATPHKRPTAYPRDPMAALRGDMERLGLDMGTVIDRERAREKATRKAHAGTE